MAVTEHATETAGVTARKCTNNPVWYIFRGSEFLGQVKLLHNGWQATQAGTGDRPARVFNMYGAAVEWLAGDEVLYAGQPVKNMTRVRLESAGYHLCTGCGLYMFDPDNLHSKCIDCGGS